ncbi:MAG: TnpV protein [Oscillospiraceae bacterium]|nr:TnpV protein [Oscillospiraceae bacterium]
MNENLNTRVDPNNGLTYTQVGEVWLPGYTEEAAEEPDNRPFGKYSRLRKAYLKEHRPQLYLDYMMDGTLDRHLRDVQEQAQNRLDTMLPEMARREGVTEELRRTDPLRWAGLMNNLKACVEEVIYQELIYV